MDIEALKKNLLKYYLVNAEHESKNPKDLDEMHIRSIVKLKSGLIRVEYVYKGLPQFVNVELLDLIAFAYSKP